MADSVGMYCFTSLDASAHLQTPRSLSNRQAICLCPRPLDRVFVHALNTVKKIPKTGASRPPPSDRLRLYGLYKQAMEGDVDGVMERPLSFRDGEEGKENGLEGDELKRERDKWDAWDAQRGVSRTEAKRRYIEALIETMHKYASTTA